MNNRESCQWVTLQPERFIPLPRHRLKDALLADFRPGLQSRWRQFFEMLEARIHYQYHRQMLEMKEDYLVLHPPDPDQHPEPEQVHQAEQRFLRHLFAMMEKAEFRPLSQEALEVAQREDYMYMLPLQIDWEQLDGEFLQRFLNSPDRDSQHRYPQPIGGKLLLFSRGTGLERTSGYFFLAKLDLLVSGLLLGLFRLPGRTLARLKALLARPSRREAKPGPAQETPSGNPPQAEPNDSIHAPRKVQRILLRHALRSWRAVFLPVVIQEPTYRELVMIYRLRSETEESHRAARPAPLHIKLFHEIPHADLEVVFPAKRISMKPVDQIKLVVTGSVGLLLAGSKLIFSAVLNPVLLLTALATVAGYGFKLIFQFRASVNRYHQLVTDVMYAKNRDNDLGVIFSLMDEVEEQEFREAALAYWLLATQGPFSTQELDARCEQWLKDRFDLEADFDVAGALEKLEQMELVTYRDGQWHAVPVEEALVRLDRAWDDFFCCQQPEPDPSRPDAAAAS